MYLCVYDFCPYKISPVVGNSDKWDIIMIGKAFNLAINIVPNNDKRQSKHPNLKGQFI